MANSLAEREGSGIQLSRTLLPREGIGIQLQKGPHGPAECSFHFKLGHPVLILIWMFHKTLADVPV